MEVLLIAPEPGGTSIQARPPSPPRGLLELASWLIQNGQEAAVLDGNLCGNDHILKVIQSTSPRIVGISANAFTYPEGVRIGKEAKRMGSRVVFGGPWATCRYREIYTRQAGVACDAVVRGTGHLALQSFIIGKKAPNLYDGSSKRSSRESLRPEFSIIFGILPWEEYFKAHQISKLPRPPYGHRPWSTVAYIGCPWWAGRKHPDYKPNPGGRHGPCVFCSIGGTISQTNPSDLWDEIMVARDSLDIDSVIDWSDSLTPRYLTEILSNRPKSCDDITWQIYLNAGTVTEELIPLLRSLRVTRVFCGFESGSDAMLRTLNKRENVADNWRAFKLLTDAHIEIEANFVLGAPGETRTTLEETVRAAKQLADYKGERLVWCSGSPLQALPGAPIFAKVMRLAGATRLRQSDFANPGDLPYLREVYLRHFCPGTGPDDLRWAMTELEKHSVLSNVFGKPL